MSKRIAVCMLALGLTGLAAPGRAVEFVEVIRGDVLVGQLDGERVVLEVAGVWVPSPPGLRAEAQYRGDSARQYVVERLRTQAVFLQALRPLRPRTVVPVRLVVGETAGQDLAVLLADAGFALCEPWSAADPDQADAICNAEKAARRARRGIHDGGFQAFAWSQSQLVDLGEFHPPQHVPLARASRRGAYAGRPSGNTSTEGGDWWVVTRDPRHRTPLDAIRDYGAALGLPPDQGLHTPPDRYRP